MKRILILIFAAVLMVHPAPASAGRIADASSAIAKKTETVVFKTNIHCKNCVRKITENISFEKGVKDLKINLEEKLVTVTFDPARTDIETLAAAIRKLGYEVSVVSPSASN